MKICAIICEFNPFHNGHKYLLESARRNCGSDAVVCIMSGSFTQRGEMCVLDKYIRAKHAVLAGADCVIQLPSAFAVAPAEIFARGAVKILSSIPEVCALSFGCENPEADFKRSAELLLDENDLFKGVLNKKLAEGESYIKSYAAAFSSCGGDQRIINSPNNILGLEYAKAILREGANIQLYPVKRIGSGYNDGELKENLSSASAIRRNLGDERLKDNLPPFVYEDLKNALDVSGEYGDMLRHSLFSTKADDLKRIYGCNEGLENRLKSLENRDYESIVKNATSKRYSSSRIRRILCANLLELYADDCERFLNADLYLKLLAVKGKNADIILPSLAKSRYPLITGAECRDLKGAARECYEKDKREYAVFNHIMKADSSKKGYDYMTII